MWWLSPNFSIFAHLFDPLQLSYWRCATVRSSQTHGLRLAIPWIQEVRCVVKDTIAGSILGDAATWFDGDDGCLFDWLSWHFPVACLVWKRRKSTQSLLIWSAFATFMPHPGLLVELKCPRLPQSQTITTHIHTNQWSPRTLHAIWVSKYGHIQIDIPWHTVDCFELESYYKYIEIWICLVT